MAGSDDDTKGTADPTKTTGNGSGSSGTNGGKKDLSQTPPPSTPSTASSAVTPPVSTQATSGVQGQPNGFIATVIASLPPNLQSDPLYVAQLIAALNNTPQPSTSNPFNMPIKPDPTALAASKIPPFMPDKPGQKPLAQGATTTTTQSNTTPTSSTSGSVPCHPHGIASGQFNTQNLHPAEKVALIHKTVKTYESRQDPKRYFDAIEGLMFHHDLSYLDMILHINMFFEDSKDKSVKDWFEPYRDKIDGELEHNVHPYQIWTDMVNELQSEFGKDITLKQAKAALRAYEYSNESVDDYIKKIRALGRKVEPTANEDRLVEMLYEHLPGHMRTLMTPSGVMASSVQRFRSTFADFLKYFPQMKQKKSSGSSSSVTLTLFPSSSSSSSSIKAVGRQNQQRQQQQSRNLCYFCGLGPHKWRECNKLKYVTKKLISEDNSLDQSSIEDALIHKGHSDSPAIANFFRDPKSYYPPNSRFAQTPQRRGQNQNRGRGNSGGQRKFMRRTNDQRNLQEDDEEEDNDDEIDPIKPQRQGSSKKKEN